MDKIKLLIVYGMVILMSCTSSKRYDNEYYHMVFKVNDLITIDFNTGLIKIDYRDFNLVDTLRLSPDERKQVMDAFSENEISEVEGYLRYYSNLIVEFPTSELVIKLCYKGGLQSEIHIVDYINVDDGYIGISKGDKDIVTQVLRGQELKVIRFRDVVLNILDNSAELKDARAKLSRYLSDNDIFFH